MFLKANSTALLKIISSKATKSSQDKTKITMRFTLSQTETVLQQVQV